MTKEWWDARRRAWAIVMSRIGKSLPEGSPVRKGMGTLAWGRYDGEPAAVDHKDNVCFGAGFLQGVRYALLMTARHQGWDGEIALENAAKEAFEMERGWREKP